MLHHLLIAWNMSRSRVFLTHSISRPILSTDGRKFNLNSGFLLEFILRYSLTYIVSILFAFQLVIEGRSSFRCCRGGPILRKVTCRLCFCLWFLLIILSGRFVRYIIVFSVSLPVWIAVFCSAVIFTSDLDRVPVE